MATFKASRQQPLGKLSPQELKAQAEARFKVRTEQATDKPKAMREYRANEQAQRDQMAKLRAERLSREAKK